MSADRIETGDQGGDAVVVGRHPDVAGAPCGLAAPMLAVGVDGGHRATGMRSSLRGGQPARCRQDPGLQLLAHAIEHGPLCRLCRSVHLRVHVGGVGGRGVPAHLLRDDAEEAEARARFKIVDIYKTSFRPIRATLSGGEDRTMMKIIVDGETDRVLGVHVLGEGAGEMIQLIGIPLRMGATKADFDATMAVHPTAAEELVTMRSRSARYENR